MLHLLMGMDRIALSDRLMDQVCREAEAGRDKQILVVPEQFSHETERRLCQRGGDAISRYAEVLSPSRMAGRVAAEQGGAARSYLDKGGRLLAMALAAEQASSRIKLYGAVLRRPEFLTDMLTMINEFQSYCLEPSMLLEAADRAQGQFAQKLEELGLLYEAYLAVCAQGSADPAGKLLWLRDVLAECDWASKRCFYFDGFSDFTGAELAVLEILLRQSGHVWVFLTASQEQPLISRPGLETARRLRRLAQKWEVPVETAQVPDSDFRDPAVSGLLRGMFRTAGKPLPPSDRICLRGFASVEEECRHGVARVKQLLAQGARCREIAVACTDLGLYEAPLKAALRMADIPFYFAGNDEILSKPVLQAVLAALNAAVGPMDYEDVALYLKSGLPLLEQDRCDRLDCYAYLWNLHGRQWERPWELHPRGFGELWTDEDRAQLEQLNEDRQTALEPLLALRTGLYQAKTTGDMVLQLHRFLETLQLRQRLEQFAQAHGGQLGQELSQLHEILLQSLEQTWLILGKTQRTPDDFSKLYRSILTQYQVGTIPAGLDQVYVSALPELRQKRTRHLLVLGAADGSFPVYRTGEGLLTEADRKTLLAQGLSLAPLREDQMDREMSSIYSALSAVSDTVWLSYAGEQPAWLFRRAAEFYPASLRTEQDELFLDVPSLAAWRLRHGDETAQTLPQLDRWEQELRRLRGYSFTPLRKETVLGLYGRQIYLSASRIDKYAACRFAFFLAYGLKAQPRRQAKLDPAAFGTFVHAVLEKTVLRVNGLGGFRQVSQETLLAVATEEIDGYAQTHFPQQAQRAAYLFRRSQREILDIVLDLGEELRHSLFQPAECELEFSADGALPPLEVAGEEAVCRISGFVDRVDLYEENGKTYVRVVDYKTGHKDFDYTDILNGAGLQMLVYLFALKQYGAERFGTDRLIPAGVLYVPARTEYTLTSPMPDDQTVAQRHREERRRKGLIRSDTDLLSAMEEDPEQPRYMPYRVGKNGPSGDLADARQMALLEQHVLRTLAQMTDRIASGDVTPDPIVRGQDSSCRFCDYKTVCHGDLCSRTVRPMATTPAEKFWEKLEEEAHHG